MECISCECKDMIAASVVRISGERNTPDNNVGNGSWGDLWSNR